MNTNVQFDSNYLNHENSQGKIAERNSRRITYIYIGKETFATLQFGKQQKGLTENFRLIQTSFHFIAKFFGKVKPQ